MGPAGDDSVVGETEVLLKVLRQELKQWEASFFAGHKRKAGREDIKQHPEIGEKYKRYNDLRYPSSKESRNKTATPTKKRHRGTSSRSLAPTATPTKRPKTAHALHPSAIDLYDPPLSTQFSPTTHRTAIGPTPQKDGVVLGLFDNLSSGFHSKTPSKRTSLVATTNRVQSTPSKHPPIRNGEPECISAGKRRYRSPLSVSKHFNLNTFQTPSTCRIMKHKTTPSSHGSVSKLHFDETPSFLRRNSQRFLSGKENVGVEDGVSWSPVALRKLPKAYAGRGLSALVKGLRDMEEEWLDEELDMVRQMEEGDNTAVIDSQPKVLVGDSQRPDMPLGPDGGLGSGDEEAFKNEEKGKDGKPLRVWKKKGQKRSTRKVVMKPNTAIWKPEPAWKAGDESETGGEESIVEDTQVAMQRPSTEKQDLHNEDFNSEPEAEEGTDGRKRPKESGGKKKEGFATKVKKKISATAHANFRALKIKNKQSKGKRGGSFRRKR